MKTPAHSRSLYICHRHLPRAAGALLLALQLVSCKLPEHQTIVVEDQSGKPVPKASLTPYPVLLQDIVPGMAANSSDSKGQLEMYKVAKDNSYTLSAPGHESRRIRFPRRDNRVQTLIRAPQ